MVRLFEFRDLDAITQIWLDSNLQAHSFVPEDYWKDKKELVRAMFPDAEIYVWETDGRVGGFIGLDAGYIAGLFVGEEFRNRGVGTELLNEAKKRKERLSLHVYEKNQRAVRFYRREEFKEIQKLTDQETGEAEILMEWRAKEKADSRFL